MFDGGLDWESGKEDNVSVGGSSQGSSPSTIRFCSIEVGKVASYLSNHRQ